MTFDTLAVATELKEAGFTPQQAEALARAWSHVASGDLATKSDLLRTESALKEDLATVKSDLEKQIVEVRQGIAGVKAELKTEIIEVRSELKAEIAEVRSDVKTLRWMIGFGLGLSLLILGKLFLIHV